MPGLDKPGVPEKLKTPRQRAQFIFDLYRKTLEKGIPSDVVMEHGTSIQVLKYWIENGVLPGRTFPDAQHTKGDLFVKIDADAIPSRKNPSPALQKMFPKQASDEIHPPTYAEIGARRDYVLEKLGIPHSDLERTIAVEHIIEGDQPQGIVDKNLRATMERILAMPGEPSLGLSPGSDMPKILAEANRRSGFILGLRRGAITRNSTLKALAIGDPDGEGDAKLVLEEVGLPIQYLGSIIPQSAQDRTDLGIVLREYLDL